ncbi:MAG: type II toxin-antitoxin system RelE/ParE family toxin [Bacteroidaceae bacterium]|nr:type II toxin-antitoxin system RelE/ParE family toxin [Bacteroidaceae bacterium]
MKLIWNSIPLRQIRNQVVWYHLHCGRDFAATFAQNIYHTAEQLRQMPTIGTIVREDVHRTIRRFVAHPGCIILYAHNKTSVHILRLFFTKMAPML